VLTGAELLARIRERAGALGLAVVTEGGVVTAEATVILTRWWLGRRSVRYRMSCRLDETARIVHFREMVVESAWGLPPPTWIAERTTIRGWRRFGRLSRRSAWGSGGMEYERVREAMQQIVSEAGWTFDLQAARIP